MPRCPFNHCATKEVRCCKVFARISPDNQGKHYSCENKNVQNTLFLCKIRYSCAKNVILAQTADVQTALCARISVGHDIVILVQILLLLPCILLFLCKSAKFSLNSHNLSKKLFRSQYTLFVLRQGCSNHNTSLTWLFSTNHNTIVNKSIEYVGVP